MSKMYAIIDEGEFLLPIFDNTVVGSILSREKAHKILDRVHAFYANITDDEIMMYNEKVKENIGK